MRTNPDPMPVRRTRPVLAAGLCFVLAACDAGSVFQGEPTPYDGRWSGRILFSAGEAQCIRRGAVRVQIDRGDLSGSVRSNTVGFGIRGQVLETGELSKGLLTRHNQPAATVTGTFTDESFDGRWADEEGRCRGTVSLRRQASR